jgi:leucyl aminopeptidase
VEAWARAQFDHLSFRIARIAKDMPLPAAPRMVNCGPGCGGIEQMLDRELDCLVESDEAAHTLRAVRPEGLKQFLEGLPATQAGFLQQSGFSAAAGSVAYLPGADGISGAVLGLGAETGPHVFGALPHALPAGSVWRLQPGDADPADAVLGFCLGAYRYAAHRPRPSAPAKLVCPPGNDAALDAALAAASASWMVRDLINAPANLLGPSELADAARALAERHGASCTVIAGEALEQDYPTVAAVGAGSARLPAVAVLRWGWRGKGSTPGPDAPLIALCGKGVCFDSGGYDIKPAAGMLRMKKDMGGAAIALGVARMVMATDLPVRLVLRIGCVENSISGSAMRPLDVLRTRRGLTVEVGNTDAEGRLVLCDLLAEASDEKPSLLVDFATLTGAARVAVGPEIAALFSNDEGWAEALLASSKAMQDPLWRLPLWPGYDSWLASPVADLGNVSTKPFAGAVTAALFLQRFLAPETPWAHLDVYAWNDQTRHGRPEGGEAQTMRAVYTAIANRAAAGAVRAG